MTNTNNLVHEADVQRHHVRVKLPAKVKINGKEYSTKDWSTAGVSVNVPQAQMNEAMWNDGKTYDIHLIFDLNGFTITVPMKVEVRHNKTNETENYVGLRYIDMTQEQIVIMQHLVNSYVTGEISSVGEIIHVMSRNNFAKPRQIPKRENLSSKENFSILLKKLAVPVVSVILLIYVFIAIFEQNFVVSAQKAVVRGDGVSVIAPSGGTVNFRNLHGGDQVKKGDILMTILSETGTVIGVDSPCDCIVEERLVGSGTTVEKGGVVLRLIPLNASLYVEANVPYKDAVRLLKGQAAILDIPGTANDITGIITGIVIDAGADSTATVTIRTRDKLPTSLAGLPIRVRINTMGWSRDQ